VPSNSVCKWHHLYSRVNQAINASLQGLPFTLHHGFIGNVAAKIPWQNVLTAPVTLAVEGLDIALKVSPRFPADYGTATGHLAESVVSVAQEFLNEELSPNENEELRESIVLAKDLPEDITASLVPGGLDPFSDDPPLQPLDPIEGVSVLATVMERLLARLSFTVDNLTLRLIHEGHSELILRIQHVEYGTEDAETSEAAGDEVRSIHITGITISMLDLHPQFTSLGTSKTASGSSTPPPPSDEEEMDASMTQSIVSLPESSLYMSATSSIRAASPEPLPPPTPPTPRTPQPAPEQTILSLGNDPIIFRLRTPTSSDPSVSAERGEISLSVKLGTLAVALHSQHIKALLELVKCLPSPSSTASYRQAPPPPNSFLDNARASVNMKGIVMVALLANPQEHHLSSFFTKPRSPLQIGHVRLSIDEISGSASAASTASSSRILEASINDISAFYIHAPGSTNASLVASPLLVFDRHLATQYDPAITKPRLPEFTVKDWTGDRASNQPKRSLWRVEPNFRRVPAEDRGVAVTFRKVIDSSATSCTHITTQPVHLFVDTNFFGCLLPFLQALTPESSGSRRRSQQYEEENDSDEMQPSPFGLTLGSENQPLEAEIGDTPKPTIVPLPGLDGEMLERMVLRDMDEEETTKSVSDLGAFDL
jgi:autophagy-related protein 2